MGQRKLMKTYNIFLISHKRFLSFDTRKEYLFYIRIYDSKLMMKIL